MAHKALREYEGQRLLARLLKKFSRRKVQLHENYAQVVSSTNYQALSVQHPWLINSKLVVKTDQLIKRRGKNSLVLLNATWDEAKAWIDERMETEITIDGTTGVLNHFVISPFIKHEQEDEYYLCIRSEDEGDEILFYHEGGVDVGDVDAKAKKMFVDIWKAEAVTTEDITKELLTEVPEDRKEALAHFILASYTAYVLAEFAYLEINPLAFVDGAPVPLDLAAKLDDTGYHECQKLWGNIKFSAPFGRKMTEAERFIERLDANSGSSMKFTLLNPEGRIWTLVAGGGASVIYADTIVDLGYGKELANYGEYSGNPTEDETYEYTKTVLDLMTKDPNEKNKVLLIGGGIANFTDVAKTFGGIIRAIRQYQPKIKKSKTKIFVRRGGPNYKEALQMMRNVGEELDIPIEVFGPETHMTNIVKMALQ